MAQKKKGGFFQRIIMGKEKAEGYARSTMPSNRWELGWDIFKGRFWKLVLINLMLVVGALGVIFCAVMMYMGNIVIGSSLPFGQNLGMGYPYVEGLEAQAVLYQIGLTNTYFLLLIPACLLLGVVFSGVFYIMRNIVWTEGIFIANDFWRGLKQNIVQILFVMLGYSVFLLISKFSLNQIEWLEFNGQGNFFFSFSRVGIWIVMILLTIMALYCLTISVTYKLTFWQLIKNSFLLTIGLLPQNLFFVLMMIAPALLGMFLSFLAPFVIMIYLLFGLSTAVLIWTNYSHWVFDRFINDRVEGAEKNRGIYQKVDLKGQPVAKKKKKMPGGFVNPKKKKKSVPEPEITELATSFSRADLERLDREKRALADAISQNADLEAEESEEEEEYEDVEALDGDFDAAEVMEEAIDEFEEPESDGSEGFEDALKLDGAEQEEYSEDPEPETPAESEQPDTPAESEEPEQTETPAEKPAKAKKEKAKGIGKREKKKREQDVL